MIGGASQTSRRGEHRTADWCVDAELASEEMCAKVASIVPGEFVRTHNDRWPLSN